MTIVHLHVPHVQSTFKPKLPYTFCFTGHVTQGCVQLDHRPASESGVTATEHELYYIAKCMCTLYFYMHPRPEHHNTLTVTSKR